MPMFKLASVDVGWPLAEQLWPEQHGHAHQRDDPGRIADAARDCRRRATTTCDVGSPFDFEDQALLYCATHMPDPRARVRGGDARGTGVAHDAAGGRTLALFTAGERCDGRRRGGRARRPTDPDAGRSAEAELWSKAFVDEESSCLFATMGFWQGVDVPGRSLSLVAIDRIPFPRPDEPLLQARRDQAGRAAFRLIDLPRAATMLAQGTGRLIRYRRRTAASSRCSTPASRAPTTGGISSEPCPR